MNGPSAIRDLVFSLALAMPCACAAPTIHPRPAEVAPPGALAWGVYLPNTVGAGRIDGTGLGTGEDGENEEHSFSGLTSGLGEVSQVGPVPPFWWEFSGRLGVLPGCELGALLGAYRLGGEARCQLVKEGREAPLSAALSFGAAWLPFFDRDGLWTRGGLDLSRRVASADMVWMGNVYLSHGPEGYFSVQLPESVWDKEQLCEDCADAPGPELNFDRREVRLATAVGAGWFIDEEYSGAVIVGLVPHFVLGAEPIDSFECSACDFQPTGYAPSWSVTLTVGYTSFAR